MLRPRIEVLRSGAPLLLPFATRLSLKDDIFQGWQLQYPPKKTINRFYGQFVLIFLDCLTLVHLRQNRIIKKTSFWAQN